MNPYLLAAAFVAVNLACFLAGYLRGMKAMAHNTDQAMKVAMDGLVMVRDLHAKLSEVES